jgi:hypothetical protein
MNAVIEFLFGRPALEPEPEPFWRNRIPQMKLEESMSNIEHEIGQLRRRDFSQEHPRDLDAGRPPLPIPETPDLFADGLEIAQSVLDWEERAGQPIAPLIGHIKAAQELRKSVTTKANGGAPFTEPEVDT